MNNEWIEVNDYDVLGVGARLRQDLLRKHQAQPILLVRHSLEFLPGVWESTLEWLRPDRIETRKNFPRGQILLQAFEKMFPLSIQHFGDVALRLMQDYVQELPWEQGLVADHFRYFPEFVKRRFSQTLYGELFLWEWIQNYLSYVDLEGSLKQERGVLNVNPSLMLMSLNEAKSVLNRAQGLFAFVYSSQTEAIQEKQLTEMDARILDLLAEDRKFTRAQLIEMLQIEKAGKSEDILVSLDSLIRSDIISTSI